MNKKYKTISWISVAAAIVIFILVNVFMKCVHIKGADKGRSDN